MNREGFPERELFHRVGMNGHEGSVKELFLGLSSKDYLRRSSCLSFTLLNP